MNMSNLTEIKEVASKYFSDISPSHDWLHVKRVASLAETIQNEEGGDLETLMLSIYLHDIGRAKEDNGEIECHAEWGAKEAEKILSKHGYSEKIIEDVQHAIKAHRYSNDTDPETLEAKILSDADNLDALGASGIARTFSYSGEFGRPLADPDLPAEKDRSEKGENALNHLEKKILNLRNRMYTDKGLEIANERHVFVENYIQRLKAEMQGEK